jgi:hypothetical protein
MRHVLAFAFGCLLPASLALADGVGPQRKMTEAEASTFATVRNTIQSALPAAPSGYTFAFTHVTDFDEGMIAEAIGPGEMFRMSFTAMYAYDDSNAGAQQMAAYMDKASGTPEQQAALAALDAKDSELREARDATRDRAEKDRIREARKAVQAKADSLRATIMTEYQAWLAAGGAAAVAQDREQSLPARELSIRVRINQTVSVPETAPPYPIEGTPLAFEKSDGCEEFEAYCITVLIGPFAKKDKVSGSDRYMLPETAPGVPTKARGIAIMIGGPKDKPEAVREFLRKVDFAKLEALVL